MNVFIEYNNIDYIIDYNISTNNQFTIKEMFFKSSKKIEFNENNFFFVKEKNINKYQIIFNDIKLINELKNSFNYQLNITNIINMEKTLLTEEILLEYGASKDYVDEYVDENTGDIYNEYYFTIDLPLKKGYLTPECFISQTNIDILDEDTKTYTLSLFDTGLAECKTLEDLLLAYKVLSGIELEKK
jgi:hypothetical protein